MKKAKVVAISGASGCGKTAIVEQLSRDFACPALHFDHYVHQSSYPQNLKRWCTSGADVNAISTPDMLRSLQELVSQSQSYIFIEEPFGRERRCLCPFIDYVVLLDLPLELCLSRLIRRHIERRTENATAAILNYLHNYEDHLRDIYQETVDQVRNHCDLIISEVLPIQTTAERIGSWLESTSLQRRG